MFKRNITIVLMSLCLLAGMGIKVNAEAKDITRQCKISLPGGSAKKDKLIDRNYMSAWENHGSAPAKIHITLPKGFSSGGLYLCFGKMPESFSVSSGGQKLASGDRTGFAHQYFPIKGNGDISLELDKGQQAEIEIRELYVFSGDEPPSWVQRWQAPYDKADMLVVAAHPDDDLIFMGGTLPYYAVERQKRVQVCYMTCANTVRRSELLNALWATGVRHYPIFGGFRDKNVLVMHKQYKLWGKTKTEAFLTDLIRKLQVQVIVTHDLKGEYGHPAHIMTAECVRKAVEISGNAEIFSESAKAHGAWSPSKLYLHLYPKNTLVMDWRKSLDSFDGKSALQVARDAFQFYVSQRSRFSVKDSGPYSNALFGLAYTNVGLDQQKDDFFENIMTDHHTEKKEEP